jgi:hypothetical protein
MPNLIYEANGWVPDVNYILFIINLIGNFTWEDSKRAKGINKR